MNPEDQGNSETPQQPVGGAVDPYLPAAYEAHLVRLEQRLREDLEAMKAWPEPPRGTFSVPTPAGAAVVQIKADEDAEAGDVVRVRFV